jgi:hypothetical protein
MAADYEEYLEEIHKIVCSNCQECLKGEPPRTPPGKPRGLTLYLPQLIDALQRISRRKLLPTQVTCARQVIFPTCASRDQYDGPCPMDTLVALLVAAGEAVDRRNAHVHEWERLIALWDD